MASFQEQFLTNLQQINAALGAGSVEMPDQRSFEADSLVLMSAMVLAATGAAQTAEWGQVSGDPTEQADLHPVATSGNYNDLSNKPDLSTLEDVEIYVNLASFPGVGDTTKLYIAQDTGYLYRWTGSAYVQLSSAISMIAVPTSYTVGTGGDFASWQAAIDFLTTKIILADVTLYSAGDTTFDENIILHPYIGPGQIILDGDNNVTIAASVGNTFMITAPGSRYRLKDLTIGAGENGIFAAENDVLVVDSCTIAAVGQRPFFVDRNGAVQISSSLNVVANPGSGSLVLSQWNGTFRAVGIPITTPSLVFANDGCFHALWGGRILLLNTSFPNAASCSGLRGTATSGGLIQASTTLPGNTGPLVSNYGYIGG
jgi:hypothetical protein